MKPSNISTRNFTLKEEIGNHNEPFEQVSSRPEDAKVPRIYSASSLAADEKSLSDYSIGFNQIQSGQTW